MTTYALESYSQHFIFFETYKWRVFVSVKTFYPSVMKRFSLLGLLVGYEENKVLCI